jgi:predicted AlkP superfamily phosphohydrolase/phosphomutase
LKDKVLVIGLDGATFDIINPLIKEGRLPNLSRLMDEGCHGKLRSTPDKVSPSAWTSFATGKNPGKHGIYHFNIMDPRALKARIINATHRDAETLWSYFSKAGKKVGVFNVPCTFPVDEVNGVMLAGWDAPSIKDEGFSHPPELIEDLLEKFDHFPTTPAIVKYRINSQQKLALKEIIRNLEARASITEYLMKENDWDFFVSVFIATDEVQHHFWHYMDDRHPLYNSKEAKKFGHAIRTVYEKCDEVVGRLIKNIDEKTTVIIMSDHGATANSMGSLYMPQWLQKMGFLKKKEMSDEHGSSPKKLIMKALGGTKKILYDKFISKLGYEQKKILKKLAGRDAGLETSSRLKLLSYDWEKTRAYIAGSNLRINLKGREAYGIVSPGKEYEDLRDELIEKLNESRDIKTGRKIVKKVYKNDEAYHGKHTDKSADLVIAWTEDFVISGIQSNDSNGKEIKVTKKVFNPGAWSGDHSDYGIFMAMGPNIRRGNKLESANIMDIAPSVIHLMGLSVPEDMDGRVMTDLFEEAFLKEKPVSYAETAGPERESRVSEYSEEDAKKTEEHLKNLGYL